MVGAAIVFAIIGAQPLPPFIAVDGFVYLVKTNRDWRYAAQSFPAAKGPLQLTSLGIGSIGRKTGAVHILGADKANKAKLKGFPSPTGVYVYGLYPAVPRPFGKTDPEKCREWVEKWLKQGFDLKNQIKILAAYEGDLDGDGADEQIAWGQIEYTEVTKPPISQALLLRANGRTYPIYAWDTYENSYSLNAVADLDGDGCMELITKVQGWGYSRATLCKFDRGKFELVPAKKLFDRTGGK